MQLKNKAMSVIPAAVLLALAIMMMGVSEVVLSAEGPKWLSTMLKYLSYLFTAGGIGALVWAGILLFEQLPRSNPASAQEPEDVTKLRSSMKRFAEYISNLKPDLEEGDKLLNDAVQKTELLVKQILALVYRIRKMEQTVANLDKAVEAIETGNEKDIARAAGVVTDRVLKRMILSRNLLQSEKYRLNVIRLLLNDREVISTWVETYHDFSESLFDELTLIQDKTKFLRAGRVMLQATSPIVEINQQLAQAATALQLRKRLGMREMAREVLPPQAVHFIEGEYHA